MKTGLNIYLIKEAVKNHKDIIKEIESVEEFSLPKYKYMKFYYKPQDSKPVKWIKLLKESVEGNLTGKTMTASGVLVVEVKKRLFVITFGYGRYMINDELFEDRFGLKTALNVIEYDKIRKADIKNIDARSRRASIQSVRLGSVDELEIHTDRDILDGVSGKSQNSDIFGDYITGSLALHITVDFNLEKLKELCEIILETHDKDDYKEHFSWIDHIQFVRPKKLIESLNEELINYINNNTDSFEKIFMAPPALINWENFRGYQYGNNVNVYDDINISEFMQVNGLQKEDIKIDVLKNKTLKCVDDTETVILATWKILDCINFEAKYESKDYMLVEGDWYEIDKDYIKKTNDRIDKVEEYSGIVFPDYNHEDEAEYNEALSNISNCILADKKLIRYGGSKSSIEFCDVVHNNIDFIHVKRFHGSSTLSHLFSQGLNSVKLFVSSDDSFRKEVKKIITGFTYTDPINKSELTVVYAIISNSKFTKLSQVIPFFSRVSLDTVLNDLGSSDIKVKWKKINIIDDVKEKKKPLKVKKISKGKK
ncbi:MAG: hypothetical protein CVV21_11490 [Candidatus Goldiibacteriota bacterium HGW-Goldbacteria-1]|jgi:uncharacterized protein (TIGR04141 family)|nr:MAG: hypothetical protein CVV21_11490 [Candidatus Goldiibacteriota bacterium HGW-Goldbacteria-1]